MEMPLFEMYLLKRMRVRSSASGKAKARDDEQARMVILWDIDEIIEASPHPSPVGRGRSR
jgi:hypothetical protein